MISTKGRYALRVIVDLAEHQHGEEYIPLKDIAARQEISEKYLEIILKVLVKEKLLKGLRGKGGGGTASRGSRRTTRSVRFCALRKVRLRRLPALRRMQSHVGAPRAVPHFICGSALMLLFMIFSTQSLLLT